jgi:hypothetical protein
MNVRVADADVVAYCRRKRSELLALDFTPERSRALELVDAMEEEIFSRLEVAAKAQAKELADNWWRNQMSEGQVP